jgi:hypothetical protein
MEQIITIFFGGSVVGILIAIGLVVLFYKWTKSKAVVVIVALFLIATRFTWIVIEPPRDDGKIEVIGETGKN